MNIFDQIKEILGFGSPYAVTTPTVRPEIIVLRDALSAGQKAKRAENYPQALEALSHAMRQAITVGDTTAIVITALNQAEVYIAQKNWGEADLLIQKTYQTAKESRQRTHMAYMLSAMGTLAQAQGKWPEAQKFYEQAVEMAR